MSALASISNIKLVNNEVKMIEYPGTYNLKNLNGYFIVRVDGIKGDTIQSDAEFVLKSVFLGVKCKGVSVAHDSMTIFFKGTDSLPFDRKYNIIISYFTGVFAERQRIRNIKKYFEDNEKGVSELSIDKIFQVDHFPPLFSGVYVNVVEFNTKGQMCVFMVNKNYQSYLKYLQTLSHKLSDKDITEKSFMEIRFILESDGVDIDTINSVKKYGEILRLPGGGDGCIPERMCGFSDMRNEHQYMNFLFS